jgi:hypothetical protein
MGRLSRWQRWLVVLGFFAALEALPVMYGLRLAHSERVTIHVVACPTKRPAKADCTGTWTMPDGRPGHGEIGAYLDRTTGVDVRGWATGSAATTELASWLVFPVAGLAIGISSWTVFAVLWLRYRRRPARPGTAALPG